MSIVITCRLVIAEALFSLIITSAFLSKMYLYRSTHTSLQVSRILQIYPLIWISCPQPLEIKQMSTNTISTLILQTLTAFSSLLSANSFNNLISRYHMLQFMTSFLNEVVSPRRKQSIYSQQCSENSTAGANQYLIMRHYYFSSNCTTSGSIVLC